MKQVSRVYSCALGDGSPRLGLSLLTRMRCVSKFKHLTIQCLLCRKGRGIPCMWHELQPIMMKAGFRPTWKGVGAADYQTLQKDYSDVLNNLLSLTDWTISG